ncbi:uncharacterized protein LOC7459129 isoform X5 [Populus trichocarpa]|uniref:Peptidase S26 domain-containing protein n=1 Tax=Populus trichocarpa TaxID=3694 RepID=A0A3N7EEB3_POPTR|nr:uncharacterized protein LOC7459129 isoform X5 [Populus trichocarpa]|eukprot:XP_024459229.1 mitochondrial inner membrane protease subunit 1 isoform X5 [Populus trichocarpa]
MNAWKSIAKEAFSQTCLVAKFLGFLHLTNNYLISPTLVYGPSMLPTLNLTGDVLLVEHVSHRFQKVPKGHIWIQGDNMYASCDSRHYGPVPYGLVQGKLFFRVWPPSSFGSFGQ